MRRRCRRGRVPGHALRLPVREGRGAVRDESSRSSKNEFVSNGHEARRAVHNARRTWYPLSPRAISSGGERLLHTQEVDGSNPSLPTTSLSGVRSDRDSRQPATRRYGRDPRRRGGRYRGHPQGRPPPPRPSRSNLRPATSCCAPPRPPTSPPSWRWCARRSATTSKPGSSSASNARVASRRRWSPTSGGRVVGHALLSRLDLTAPEQQPRGRPSRWRRWPSPPTIRAAASAASWCEHVFVPRDPRLPIFVIGDPAFYGRFGFESAVPHGVKPRFEVAPEHFMVRLAGRHARRRGRTDARLSGRLRRLLTAPRTSHGRPPCRTYVRDFDTV